MDMDRLEMVRRRLAHAKLSPPIAVSSVYYLEDVEFLLSVIRELTSDHNCETNEVEK